MMDSLLSENHLCLTQAEPPYGQLAYNMIRQNTVMATRFQKMFISVSGTVFFCGK